MRRRMKPIAGETLKAQSRVRGTSLYNCGDGHRNLPTARRMARELAPLFNGTFHIAIEEDGSYSLILESEHTNLAAAGKTPGGLDTG